MALVHKDISYLFDSLHGTYKTLFKEKCPLHLLRLSWGPDYRTWQWLRLADCLRIYNFDASENVSYGN